jgi:hypothetical protein
MQIYVITLLNARNEQVWDVCLNLKIIAYIYNIYICVCILHLSTALLYWFLYILIFVSSN